MKSSWRRRVARSIRLKRILGQRIARVETFETFEISFTPRRALTAGWPGAAKTLHPTRAKDGQDMPKRPAGCALGRGRLAKLIAAPGQPLRGHGGDLSLGAVPSDCNARTPSEAWSVPRVPALLVAFRG